MSLNAFREALKPCKSNLLSSEPSFFSSSQFSSGSDSSINPRKPPKSSVYRQLLRLHEDTDFYPESQLGNVKREANLRAESEVDAKKKVEEDEEEKYGPKDPKLESFHIDISGPYEPLLLSLPGDSPVVQVFRVWKCFMYYTKPKKLTENERNDESAPWPDCVTVVPASINSRLLEHQRQGVKFMYNLYRNNHGGLLGDDMGLGKTIQTIAFLAAVYGKGSEPDLASEEGKQIEKGPVLIICPSSVILNWESEFSSWATFKVAVYHGANRDLIIDKLGNRDVEVLVTSFDTYRIQGSMLSDIQWEIVVVDEAHRLKNEKSKLYNECLKIKTLKRYGLTGTMMQNKIMELFNLFDWVVPGGLGTREHFREFYDEPLKLGQRLSAPQRFVQVAEERKQHLMSVLQKYMLRRTKDETIGHLMMGKEDNIVFCAMTELQKRAYQRMLQLPDIQCLINKDLPCSCGSPLKQVECCKRTVPNGAIWPYLHRDNPDGCDSCPFCLVLPCLVKLQQISNHLELIKPNSKDDPDKQRKDEEFASAVFGEDIYIAGGSAPNDSFMGLSDVRHCGKMKALERLMGSWISKGDKILLFSYSVRMLDILEKFIIRKGYSFSRLDGSTPTSSRQSLVDGFNSSPSKQVFLISTRAGGLGLNLVSANRVVIFDPNWNPAQDLQAQDRSFRYGQKRHVTVLRLLAAGSVEELVYTRQVYKQQLSNIAVAGKMEKRYFEGVQDRKEFQGELFGICNLFRDLSSKLFTREIIELPGNHEKQHPNHDDHPKLNLMELGMSLDIPQEETTMKTSTLEPKYKRKAAVDPLFEDLGVVYAHRNEDVVNFRSRIHHHPETTTGSKVEAKQTCTHAEERDASDANAVEVKDTYQVSESSKRRKNDHSAFLSMLMGFDEVELNKLLLSEPPT